MQKITPPFLVCFGLGAKVWFDCSQAVALQSGHAPFIYKKTIVFLLLGMKCSNIHA